MPSVKAGRLGHSVKPCPEEVFEAREKYNAQAIPIWKPMHMHPIYQIYGFVTREGNGQGIDVGADTFQRGLCLPSDNKMTAEEQDNVIEIIRSCFK